MMPIKAVFFDLFGTLLDDSGLSNIYDDLFRELGFNSNHSSRDYARKLIKTQSTVDLNTTLKLLNADVCDQYHLVNEFQKRLDDEIKAVQPINGVLEIIQKLKNKDIKCFIISNVSTPYLNAYYGSPFVTLMNGTAFSCEYGLVKPDPNFFHKALKNFSVSVNTTIMIGNSLESDKMGAETAGMRAYLLTPGTDLASIMLRTGLLNHDELGSQPENLY